MKHLEHTRSERKLWARMVCVRMVCVRGMRRVVGKTIAAVLCVCAVTVGTAPAMADSRAQFWVQSSMLSLDEAADRVQGAFGGRVVAAQPVRAGGRDGFRVRVLLDDGRVITVFVDADSGAMRQMG